MRKPVEPCCRIMSRRSSPANTPSLLAPAQQLCLRCSRRSSCGSNSCPITIRRASRQLVLDGAGGLDADAGRLVAGTRASTVAVPATCSPPESDVALSRFDGSGSSCAARHPAAYSAPCRFADGSCARDCGWSRCRSACRACGAPPFAEPCWSTRSRKRSRCGIVRPRAHA
jgi:hypothetical protein